MQVVASDQGFLPAPVPVTSLSLMPGKRRAILIEMSQGEGVVITVGEAVSLMDRIRSFFETSSIPINTTVWSGFSDQDRE